MSTVVQNTKVNNGLAQTFNNVYVGFPVEGNLLIAWIYADEATTDIATLTSAGWTRMGTFVATLGGFDYRISCWAKFAGAGETKTVSWDLGEANRRAHGYAVEFSGVPLLVMPATDSAAKSTSDNGGATGNSNQVDDAIDIGGGQFGVVMQGVVLTSAVPPTWATEVTFIDNWSINFKASGIGFVDPAATVQPLATWGNVRHNLQVIFVLGDPIAPVTVKAHSSFQLMTLPAS